MERIRSAFNCSNSNDEISFLHGHFINVTKECSNKTIVGQGLRVENNHYTSQLTVKVNVEPEVQGNHTIECVSEDSHHSEFTEGSFQSKDVCYNNNYVSNDQQQCCTIVLQD